MVVYYPHDVNQTDLQTRQLAQKCHKAVHDTHREKILRSGRQERQAGRECTHRVHGVKLSVPAEYIT
jgi:hypothetical protein